MADQDDKKPQDAIAEMQSRYDRAAEQSRERYDEARNDIRFVTVPGAQWDEKIRARRGDRPCYEFPKLSSHTRQVINEMRQARPQGKIRGVQDGDTGLAEIMQGLCRNIEDVSNASLAYDVAFQAAVEGGMGWWRINTDYANPDDFNLDVQVRPVYNPFAVKCDPAAMERDRSDMNYLFFEDFMATDDFKRQYPKASVEDFESDDFCKNWRDAGKIRVAEYWYKKPLKRELWALSNGDTVWEDESDADALQAAGIQVLRTRVVDSHKVCMRLTNGHEWLTDEYEFPSQYIPFVPVWGDIKNLDGEDYWQGMVRPAKDQQRLHNIHRTALVESVAKSPKAPFIVKMKWIQKYVPFWNRANADDLPYLPIDDNADDIPKRVPQAEVPAALIQLAQMDNDDIKATTGIYDASLGARSNETSGVAIGQRKQQGAVATFNYSDNLAYAIRYSYAILIDMIPKVYDTPRTVRILGQDGGEKWKQLYQTVTDPTTGQQIVLNDISKGKYDVTVTVGPSFATQRMEAVDAFTTLTGQVGPISPILGQLLSYQVLKNLDLPGSEAVAEAVRVQLVKGGLLPPQEGDPPPTPPPPNPIQQAQIQKMLADASRAQAGANRDNAEAQVVIPKAIAEVGKDHMQAADTHAATVQAYHRMTAPPMPSTAVVDGLDAMPPRRGY